MTERSVPAMAAPQVAKDNPLTRSVAGLIGIAVLTFMVVVCLVGGAWTMGSQVPEWSDSSSASPRYDLQDRLARHLPPSWWGVEGDPTDENTSAGRLRQLHVRGATLTEARARGVTSDALAGEGWTPSEGALSSGLGWSPRFFMGTDLLGRSLFYRCLAGGAISLGIGISAAIISVFLGTLYGALAGYAGGRVDAVMMRIVDVLFGLPYVLLVVLLAVAVEAAVDDWQGERASRAEAARSAYVEERLTALDADDRTGEAIARLTAEARTSIDSGELSDGQLRVINLLTLLIAIGGVSWLTMARVVRGQVLSLKAQPFMEAARAIGVPVRFQFIRHLLPNLLGPIVVYATLTVPQAILQESFLSFLGIGVRPPLPSWGNLAAEGLDQLNPYKSHWWLLLFPCLLLGITLLALNFVGEGLREAFDPKRARR